MSYQVTGEDEGENVLPTYQMQVQMDVTEDFPGHSSPCSLTGAVPAPCSVP